MPMTPRERVLATLAHETPGPRPDRARAQQRDGHQDVHVPARQGAGGHRGAGRVHLRVAGAGHGEAGRGDLPAPPRADVRGVLDHFPAATRARNATRDPHSPFIDDWGSGQVEGVPGTWFPGWHPMADAFTLEEIEAYPWPDMTDPTRFEGVRAEAQRLRDENAVRVDGHPVARLPAGAGVRHAGNGQLPGQPRGRARVRRGAPVEDPGAVQGADGRLPARVWRPHRHGEDRRRPGIPGGAADVTRHVPADPQADPRGPDRVHPGADEGRDRVPHGRRRVRPAGRLHRDRRGRPQPGPGVGRRACRDFAGLKREVRGQPRVLWRDGHAPRAPARDDGRGPSRGAARDRDPGRRTAATCWAPCTRSWTTCRRRTCWRWWTPSRSPGGTRCGAEPAGRPRRIEDGPPASPPSPAAA